MHVYTYVCTYVRMSVYIHTYVYVTYACMYTCIRVCIYTYIHLAVAAVEAAEAVEERREEREERSGGSLGRIRVWVVCRRATAPLVRRLLLLYQRQSAYGAVGGEEGTDVLDAGLQVYAVLRELEFRARLQRHHLPKCMLVSARMWRSMRTLDMQEYEDMYIGASAR